jgi:xanthine dehydrogenase YagR molybdenum-binding subunit
MFSDGGVTLKTGAMDLGTGTKTCACMVAAEELGIPLENIRIVNADAAVVAANPLRDNVYKVEMVKGAVEESIAALM